MLIGDRKLFRTGAELCRRNFLSFVLHTGIACDGPVHDADVVFIEKKKTEKKKQANGEEETQ